MRHARRHSAGGGRADFLLDALGGGFADQQIMVAADIGMMASSILSPPTRTRARIDDAAKRQHGDFGGAAADIDDHRAGRLVDGQAGADRGRHRLLDQVHAARAGRQRGFLNGAALDGRRAGRHANDDLRIGEGAAVMHLADELLDHFLGDFEIGDDAVAHRADGLHVARRAAQHHLGFVADREHLLLAAFVDDGDDRRLIQNDAAALDVNQRVRGPEVDRHIAGKHAEETTKHKLFHVLPVADRVRTHARKQSVYG